VTKLDVATTTTNEYLFPGGLAAHLPPGVELVVDANIPTNVGAGTNETVILVGEFRAGAYFFQRQPLTIEASSDAGFTTDETVVRGVERYGFAVVLPGAFEVLTGITP
jgi:HK97 family phage major capsid protein